jgi:hypothetical protein
MFSDSLRLGMFDRAIGGKGGVAAKYQSFELSIGSRIALG